MLCPADHAFPLVFLLDLRRDEEAKKKNEREEGKKLEQEDEEAKKKNEKRRGGSDLLDLEHGALVIKTSNNLEDRHCFGRGKKRKKRREEGEEEEEGRKEEGEAEEKEDLPQLLRLAIVNVCPHSLPPTWPYLDCQPSKPIFFSQ